MRCVSSLPAALCCFWILTGPCSTAWAQDEPSEAFAKEGFFIGFLAWPSTTIEGEDFNGRNYLYDADEALVIPALNSGEGWGLAFGGRSRSGAIEVSYIRAKHRAIFLGARGDAISHAINIDAKGFLFARTRVQPYFSGGLALPWLVVKEGSVSPNGIGDATFLGVGLNLGTGFTVYVHPRIGLTGGYNYRFLVFHRAQGASGSFKDVDEDVAPVGHNGNFCALVSFAF
jgi:hypothetical protein